MTVIESIDLVLLYKELEVKHDVTIFDLEKNEDLAKKLIECNGYDNYQGCSSCSGKEIYLGFYNDDELKLVSLFHELGHMYFNAKTPCDYSERHDYRSFPYELQCTRIGLDIAYDQGIVFSDHALAWIYSQAYTYLRNQDDRPLLISDVMQKEFTTRKIYGRNR